MKKRIEKMRALPLRTRYQIVIGAVVVVFIIGIFTYRFWGSFPSQVGKSFLFEAVGNAISESKNGLQTNEIQSSQNKINELLDSLSDDKAAQQKTTYTNEMITLDALQKKNDVTLQPTKILIDPSITVLWFVITNNGKDTITFDPKTSFELRAKDTTALPQALGSEEALKTFLENGTATEVIEATHIEAGQSIIGFTRFDALPQADTTTLSVKNVLAESARTKWDYALTLNTKRATTAPRLPQQ